MAAMKDANGRTVRLKHDSTTAWDRKVIKMAKAGIFATVIAQHVPLSVNQVRDRIRSHGVSMYLFHKGQDDRARELFTRLNQELGTVQDLASEIQKIIRQARPRLIATQRMIQKFRKAS